MHTLIACLAILAASSGCASNDASQRPAANPATEPNPISDTQGAQPDTKTVVEPPAKAPVVDTPTSEPPEPKADPQGPSGPAARNGEADDEDQLADNNHTASAQGNTESDLSITQRIRKAVVHDSKLSFAAKNVKIVTEAGEVTLRGNVNNDQERNKVGTYASQAAGEGRVHNQLNIEP